MGNLEIDAKILSDFVEKVTLKSKIAKTKLLTNSDGMFTRMNMANHIITEGLLNKTTFHKFEEDITLDIRDTLRFGKILKSFKDKLNIGIEDVNILMRGVNKTAHFKLASDIDTFRKDPMKLDYDNGFDVPKSFIEEIKTNLTNLETDCVELEVKDKKLTVTTKGQEDTITQEMNVEYKDCKFLMSAEYFKNVMDVIDSGDVNLSFQDMEMYEKNPPLKITEKSKINKFYAWVAPFRKDT